MSKYTFWAFLPRQFSSTAMNLESSNGAVVSQVIDLVGRKAFAYRACLFVPVGVWFWREVNKAVKGFYHVVNVGKVAAHPAVVEDFDGHPCQDVAGEGKVSHVRPSPGAVDGKEAHPRRGDAVKVGIGVGHQFVCLFVAHTSSRGGPCCAPSKGDGLIAAVNGA